VVLAAEEKVNNLTSFLPSLLNLERKPMTLDDHFVFYPLFSTYCVPNVTVRAGRQIGKTHQTSARLILDLATQPGYKVLVVLPLQEQSDRMSSIIFKPMVDESPVRAILGYEGSMGSVRRRKFDNGSLIYFSYAGADANRVRGIAGIDQLYVDESQDLDSEHLPILRECQSSRPSPVTILSGTSKTNGSLLEKSWMMSSQGVWHIKCDLCSFDNICCIEPDGHMMTMLGPVRDDISENEPGLVCHRCQKPVRPRHGRWVHRFPERRRDSVGYFIPQPIMPSHYAHPVKWSQLIGKMNGAESFTVAKFHNEVLGEAYDQAYKLITEEQLREAAQGVGPNTMKDAMNRMSRYPFIVLGVDWGGGGESGASRTSVAAVGFNHDGTAEAFFGYRFPPTIDPISEGKEIARLAGVFRAQLIAHDGNGSGRVSEATVTQCGWPITRIAPMVYRATVGGDMVEHHKAVNNRSRGFYSLDKGQSLQFLCSAIKAKKLRFFNYDYADVHQTGLIYDFTNLAQELKDSSTGQFYRIVKVYDQQTDDFAHAVNFAACAGWEASGGWPNLVTVGRVNPYGY